ncbi:MAG: hypothetical protein H6Q41_5291 [Deltaproteobacteria bacterium]|jgi:hypothetical protein|nr:hypothetical protein [Deltaproteobacteria bacterium]
MLELTDTFRLILAREFFANSTYQQPSVIGQIEHLWLKVTEKARAINPVSALWQFRIS